MMHIVLASLLSAQLVVECRLNVDSSNNIETNLAAEPDSIHSLYRSLFHMGTNSNNKKEEKLVEGKVVEKHIEIVNRISIPESEGLRLLISVTSMLWDTAWKVNKLLSLLDLSSGTILQCTRGLKEECT